MNPFVFFAVFFATATVILAFYAHALRDENQQLRSTNDELLDAGNELVMYHDALELRNDWLEAEYEHTNDLRAAANMFMPTYRVRGEKLTVGEESP